MKERSSWKNTCTVFWILFLGAQNVHLGWGSNKLGVQTDRQTEKWTVIPINPSQPRRIPAIPLETSFARANRFSFVLLWVGVVFSLFCFKIALSITVSLTYSFWALVISLCKMENKHHQSCLAPKADMKLFLQNVKCYKAISHSWRHGSRYVEGYRTLDPAKSTPGPRCSRWQHPVAVI